VPRVPSIPFREGRLPWGIDTFHSYFILSNKISGSSGVCISGSKDNPSAGGKSCDEIKLDNKAKTSLTNTGLSLHKNFFIQKIKFSIEEFCHCNNSNCNNYGYEKNNTIVFFYILPLISVKSFLSFPRFLSLLSQKEPV
jgi:hypothetical protein